MAHAQSNFSSGAAALSQTLRMEGVAYQIVGVVPASFRFPREAQVWLETAAVSRLIGALCIVVGVICLATS